MPRYTFDVTLLATFTVDASGEAAARGMIHEAVNGNEANFGAWPDGSPVLAEVGIEGALDLDSIDGEPA